MTDLSATVGNELSSVSFREAALRAQQKIKDAIESGEMIDAMPHCPVTHEFTPVDDKYGCAQYMRTMEIKAGCYVVGKIHRHAHPNVVSQGTILVATEYGVKMYRAPHHFISEPGLKRVVYAITDTVWSTIHLTDVPGEDNLDDIEKEVISPSYGELGLEDSMHKIEVKS